MDLYPELVDYIFNHCRQFFKDDEIQAHIHGFSRAKVGSNSRRIQKKSALKELFSEDPKVLELLKNGFSNFKQNTAMRIYTEHKNELKLNKCPNCTKVARTPKAKQCRFCFHKWH